MARSMSASPSARMFAAIASRKRARSSREDSRYVSNAAHANTQAFSTSAGVAKAKAGSSASLVAGLSAWNDRSAPRTRSPPMRRSPVMCMSVPDVSARMLSSDCEPRATSP
jgi:hypothetical protein